MERPKVSIIVPIYNVEKYLDRCMDSLLNQTLKDIEIIMVDDGSPDNCPWMCDEYAKKDSRVKVIHKKNAGLGMARNSGLEIANGEYVAFVDSDDYVDCHMYEALYNKVKEMQVDAVLCKFYLDDKGDVSEGDIDGMPCKESVVDFRTDYIPNVVGCLPDEKCNQLYGFSVWNLLFSRNIIERNKLRFESERNFVSEDILFQLDFAACASKLLLYPKPFYFYCNNAGSLTKKYDYTRYDREVLLYKEIGRRLQCKKIAIPDIELRLSRLLLYKCLFSVCDTIKYLPYKESIIQLAKITENVDLQKILHSYPLWKMCLIQRIFFLLLKHKQARLVYWFYKLKH